MNKRLIQRAALIAVMAVGTVIGGSAQVKTVGLTHNGTGYTTNSYFERPPSWAVGTFRGVNRKYSLNVELRISESGLVTRSTWKRDAEGNADDTVEGSWQNGEIVFVADRYRVERSGNGFSTVKVNDRNDSTDFRRTFGGGGGFPGDGGGNGGGGNAQRPPSWAVGVFRGSNRKYNLDVEINVSERGKATRVTWKRGTDRERPDSVDGVWRDGQLVFGGDKYNVSRSGSGLYTVKENDREDTTDLRRSGSGGGGGNGGGGSGDSRPPSWAVGTFRGRNDKYRLDVELRISRNGTVDRYIWNNDNKPDSERGKWDNDEIVFGKDRYLIYKSGNGIKTQKKGDSSDSTDLRRR